MLSVEGVLELLNDKAYEPPQFIVKWRGVYFGMSLHTNGACPAFKILSPGGNQGNMEGGRNGKSSKGWIYPVGYYGWQYQQIFELYLLNRHPREPEATFHWRLSQYKPYTRTPFLKVMQKIVGAIFQQNNYTLHIEDKEENDYIWGPNFNGLSLPAYIASKFQWICEDPNGFFITIPREPYYATTTKRIEPHTYFIPSKDIISLTDDEVIFTIYDITWVANNVGYFRFKKDHTGNYIHIDEANGGYFAHMLGRNPRQQAGGVWNTQGFFESWLVAAKAIADDFVSSKSAEQLVNKEASHPFIIEASTDCPDCSGLGKVQEACEVSDENPLGQMVTPCRRCGGSGEISHNPADRLVVPVEDMQNHLVQIINPDVNVNKFHADYNKDLYNSMMCALHLNYIEQAQSGVAKDKDMESQYQFISQISNDLFDRLISGIVADIMSLRNVQVADGKVVPATPHYIIIKPTQFQIKTSADLLDEYDAASKAKIPDYIRAKQVETYISKLYGDDPVMLRKMSLINQMDVLAVTDEGDKETRLLGGAINPRTWQFNVELPKMLDELLRTKGIDWFMQADYNAIKAEVDVLFAAIPAVKDVPASMHSFVGQ